MKLDWQIVYAGGVFISLFLFILMISKRRKNIADKILSTWLFFAVIHQALIGWYAAGRLPETPALIGWELPFPYLHGPFLYLYVLFITGQQRHGRWNVLHFLPAALVAVVLAPVLTSMSVETKLHGAAGSGFEALFQWMVAGIFISGVVYVFLSLLLLYRHRRNIAGQFSNTGKITLNWLRYLIGGMAVIWAVVIFYPSGQALYLAVALFIFFIGYFGIRQVGIFADTPIPQETPAPDAPEDPKVKYEKNRLAGDEATRIHNALTSLMRDQQRYKDPELTLGDLAQALNVHPNILSQVINSKEQKTFYDYVNVLRVEAFKQLVQEPGNRQYTLLGLAFECGFNSKTSFNRNFRKVMQMSPSDYLKGLGRGDAMPL